MRVRCTIPEGSLKDHLSTLSAEGRRFEILRLATNTLENQTTNEETSRQIEPQKVTTTSATPDPVQHQQQESATLNPVNFGSDLLNL